MRNAVHRERKYIFSLINVMRTCFNWHKKSCKALTLDFYFVLFFFRFQFDFNTASVAGVSSGRQDLELVLDRVRASSNNTAEQSEVGSGEFWVI